MSSVAKLSGAKGDLKQAPTDRTAAQDAIAQATAMREKEAAVFAKYKPEHDTNIAAIVKAVDALEIRSPKTRLPNKRLPKKNIAEQKIAKQKIAPTNIAKTLYIADTMIYTLFDSFSNPIHFSKRPLEPIERNTNVDLKM